MDKKIPIYARINQGTKDRAFIYVTKSKIQKDKAITFSKLVEESLEYYMLHHIL